MMSWIWLVPCSSEVVDFLRKFFAGQLLAFDGEGDDERIVTNMLWRCVRLP